MRTLEKAAEAQGVSLNKDGLRLHFPPLPNWYGCFLGCICPVCDAEVTWAWKGEMPGITTDITPSLVSPVVAGGVLHGYGHRWITIECNGCGTVLYCDNFD